MRHISCGKLAEVYIVLVNWFKGWSPADFVSLFFLIRWKRWRNCVPCWWNRILTWLWLFGSWSWFLSWRYSKILCLLTKFGLWLKQKRLLRWNTNFFSVFNFYFHIFFWTLLFFNLFFKSCQILILIFWYEFRVLSKRWQMHKHLRKFWNTSGAEVFVLNL